MPSSHPAVLVSRACGLTVGIVVCWPLVVLLLPRRHVLLDVKEKHHFFGSTKDCPNVGRLGS